MLSREGISSLTRRSVNNSTSEVTFAKYDPPSFITNDPLKSYQFHIESDLSLHQIKKEATNHNDHSYMDPRLLKGQRAEENIPYFINFYQSVLEEAFEIYNEQYVESAGYSHDQMKKNYQFYKVIYELLTKVEQLTMSFEKRYREITDSRRSLSKNIKVHQKEVRILTQTSDKVKSELKLAETRANSCEEDAIQIIKNSADKMHLLGDIAVDENQALKDFMTELFSIMTKQLYMDFEWKKFSESYFTKKTTENFVEKMISLTPANISTVQFKQIKKLVQNVEIRDIIDMAEKDPISIQLKALIAWADKVVSGFDSVNKVRKATKDLTEKQDRIDQIQVKIKSDEVDKEKTVTLLHIYSEKYSRLKAFRSELFEFKNKLDETLVAMNNSYLQLMQIKKEAYGDLIKPVTERFYKEKPERPHIEITDGDHTERSSVYIDENSWFSRFFRGMSCCKPTPYPENFSELKVVDHRMPTEEGEEGQPKGKSRHQRLLEQIQETEEDEEIASENQPKQPFWKEHKIKMSPSYSRQNSDLENQRTGKSGANTASNMSSNRGDMDSFCAIPEERASNLLSSDNKIKYLHQSFRATNPQKSRGTPPSIQNISNSSTFLIPDEASSARGVITKEKVQMLQKVISDPSKEAHQNAKDSISGSIVFSEGLPSSRDSRTMANRNFYVSRRKKSFADFVERA